jgi:hypothetical protein
VVIEFVVQQFLSIGSSRVEDLRRPMYGLQVWYSRCQHVPGILEIDFRDRFLLNIARVQIRKRWAGELSD